MEENTALLVIFGVLSILTGSFAAFSKSIKKATLFLWMCGLFLGSYYLSIGAEFMALVQWMISTLVYLTFIFHSQMYRTKKRKPDWVKLGLSSLIAAFMLTGVYLGVSSLQGELDFQSNQQSVLSIGRFLLSDQLLSIEVVSLTLFLVIIGVGIVGKREDQS